MPIEEYRFIYLGVYDDVVNVYLGNASAKIAKSLYDKVGININIEKTDILASVEEYEYLVTIKATKLNKSNYNKSDIKTLLDAYHIMIENNLNTEYINKKYDFSYDDLYKGNNIVMFNKTINMSAKLESIDISDYSDNIVAITDWKIVKTVY